MRAAITDEDADGYVGAESATSMTCGITAQVFGAALATSVSEDASNSIPGDIVYDNKNAADFARSTAESGKHTKLNAAVGDFGKLLA